MIVVAGAGYQMLKNRYRHQNAVDDYAAVVVEKEVEWVKMCLQG
jgi:hypothetical protein